VIRTHWLWAAGALFVTSLGVAPPATATSVSVTIGSDSATLTYRAAPGERNGVGIEAEYSPTPGVYLVWFDAGTLVGPGCEPYSGNPARAARCGLPPGLRHQASIRLGDRNDGASLERAGGLPARVAGGPGDDVITGPGNKDLQGVPLWLWSALDPPQPKLGRAAALAGSGPPSYLWGGSGADEVWGGVGDDVIDPGPDVDLVVGFGGDDRIVATDGVIDYIECDKGSDRLTLDMWELRVGAMRANTTPRTPDRRAAERGIR
jgi:hypothetical protein